MAFIALIILLGTLLVFLETVLVGGIWCIAGLICYGWAVWQAYSDYGLTAAIAASAICVGMCVTAFMVWLYVIPKTSFGKKLYLNSAQSGRAPSADCEGLISKVGVTVTALVPSGKVEIDGKLYDAISSVAHLEKGERIEVVAADAFGLRVRKI